MRSAAPILLELRDRAPTPMRPAATILLLFLTSVSLSASAQEEGPELLLDSLVSATNCPKRTVAILDRVGDLADVHLCALVATALDHLAQQDAHPWAYPDGHLPSDSRASVFEVHARSSQGRILESAWSIELEIPESSILYRILIDQRTGRTVSQTINRSSQRREGEPAQHETGEGPT